LQQPNNFCETVNILACRNTMDEAGVTPDQIEGVICCDSHIAGASGGSASQRAPRSCFAPPYDSEWGLTLINAKWLMERRVKKGQSGNPRGPRRTDMSALLIAALNEPVYATIDGERRKITKRQAIDGISKGQARRPGRLDRPDARLV